MTSTDKRAGFTCECGKFHEFAAFVYAHWRIPLTHICDACGREHRILKGKATLLKESKSVTKAQKAS